MPIFSKKQSPEEFKTHFRPREDVKVEILEDTSEAMTRALKDKDDPLVKFMLSNIKTDEKFFRQFMMFLERTLTLREILLSVVKRSLIETSKSIYS